jgi:Ca2+:H+ antiporter
MTRVGTTGSVVIAPPRSDIRDSQLYQRILGQSLKQTVQSPVEVNNKTRPDALSPPMKSPHIVPPRRGDGQVPGLHLQSLSEADNQTLALHVAEMAATAAAVAARDATKIPKKTSQLASQVARTGERPQAYRAVTSAAEAIDESLHPGAQAAPAGGGHDAPNWSRTKSAVILLTATLAYAVIAEILVNTVDVVLENFDIDEKFLGITLFALVPNTTEFLVSHLTTNSKKRRRLTCTCRMPYPSQ